MIDKKYAARDNFTKEPRSNENNADPKKTHFDQRLEGKSLAKTLGADTGQRVGWLYSWNTGELKSPWLQEPREILKYEVL